MASEVQELLPGLPLLSGSQTNTIFYGDSDFSPREGELDYFSSGNYNHNFTIVRGKSKSEHLVFVVHKPSKKRQHQQSQFNRDRECKLLKFILSPLLDYSQLSLDSLIEPHGDQGFIFNYGPCLYRRISTLSYELQQLCKLLDLNQILRVEIGRHFTTKLVQYPGEEQVEFARNFLIGGSGLEQYLLHIDKDRHIPVTTLTPYVDDGKSYFNDPVSTYVMLSPFDGGGAQGPQASTSLSPPYRQYGISWTPSHTSIFPSGKEPKNPTIREAVNHLHSEASIIGRPQLQGFLFQQSLMPFGETLAATCGAYAGTPSDGIPDAIPGNLSAMYNEAFQALNCQSSSMNRLGIPVVSGFFRTFDETFHPATYNTLLCFSTFTSCATNLLQTSRFQSGQYIVSLGEFLPTTKLDAPPFPYRESTTVCNAIVNTLKLFGPTNARICISSSARLVGHASVEDHLFALLPRGGAQLYLSQLPPTLLDQIREREHMTDIQAFISKFYLQTTSSQMFLVLKNELVGTQRKQGYKFLKKVAALCNCPCHVIGVTCEEPGLHFVNDIGTLSGTSPGTMNPDPSLANFVVLQSSKLKKTEREYRSEQDVTERLINDMDESIDWDLYVPRPIIYRVLSHPTVASKEFFVRHQDRCGNGLIRQQPGVGPLDLPLADYSLVMDYVPIDLTGPSFTGDPNPFVYYFKFISQQDAANIYTDIDQWFTQYSNSNQFTYSKGHVIAIGEQGYKMLSDPFIGVQYGVTELLTNIMLGPPCMVNEIQVSASIHWNEGPDYRLELDKVMAACNRFCSSLGLSLSYTSACSSSTLETPFEVQDVNALNLFTFTGKAKVDPSGPRLTPELQSVGNTLLHVAISREVLIAGSVFEHTMSALKETLTPINHMSVLNLFQCVQTLILQGLAVSGHDVSDGGLITCCLEMAMAGVRGFSIQIERGINPLAILLSETPGAVLEIPPQHLPKALQICESFSCFAKPIGTVGESGINARVSVHEEGFVVFEDSIQNVLHHWRTLADGQFLKLAAKIEEGELYRHDYGENEVSLASMDDYFLNKNLVLFRNIPEPPGVAILCLPLCPKPLSLMSAFVQAGFGVSVLNISDLASKNSLRAFVGLAIGGSTGFGENYLGSRGLSQFLIQHPQIEENISFFLKRRETFSLGCGELGIQMLMYFDVFTPPDLKETQLDRDRFQRKKMDLEKNASHLTESLWLNFKVPSNTKSIMLRPLAGMVIPCWANGQYLGVRYTVDGLEYSLDLQGMISLFFHGKLAMGTFARNYPRNPSGNSPVAGLCSLDGRHLGLLCDPSLAIYPWQWQHIPKNIAGLKTSPWALMFHNMFLYCLKNRV
nr:homolog of EHV2 ORF75 tegument protein G75 [Macronycteris gammaherpesvirus 1]